MTRNHACPSAAVALAHMLGCNPHGEVQGVPVPPEMWARLEPSETERVLPRAECDAIDARWSEL